MLECKGSCNFMENGYFGNPKYGLGYKYCSRCSFSIKYESNLCPCCKNTLRQKPRHKSITVNPLKKFEIKISNTINEYKLLVQPIEVNEQMKNPLILEVMI